MDCGDCPRMQLAIKTLQKIASSDSGAYLQMMRSAALGALKEFETIKEKRECPICCWPFPRCPFTVPLDHQIKRPPEQ